MGLSSFFEKLNLKKGKKEKKMKPPTSSGVSKPKHGTRAGRSPTSPTDRFRPLGSPTMSRHTRSPSSSEQSSPSIARVRSGGGTTTSAYSPHWPSALLPAGTPITTSIYKSPGFIPPGVSMAGSGYIPDRPPGTVSPGGSTAGPLYIPYRPPGHDPAAVGSTGPGYVPYRPPIYVPAGGGTAGPVHTPPRPPSHVPSGSASTGPDGAPTGSGGASPGSGHAPTGPHDPVTPGVAAITRTQPTRATPEEIANGRLLPLSYVRGLNKYGAINIDWSQFPNLTFDLEGRPGGLNLRKRVDTTYEWGSPIHPCFRREKFTNISDAEWTLIEPSVRLASCYLDDPRIVPFFNGLLHRPRKLHPLVNTIKKDEVGTTFYTFREKDFQDQAEMLEVYKKIAVMRDSIDITFGDIGESVIGLTERTFECDVDGNPTGDYEANIFVHQDFLHVLDGTTKPSSILLPPELGEPCDDNSALLRVRFMLAKVLLHEFGHAFSHIHFPLAGETMDEPFYGDFRVAEMGFCLEQFVNGTVVQTVRGNECSTVDCAYGLMTMRFPGILRGVNVNGYELAPPVKYGVLQDTHFAVPMDSVAKLWTRRFWDDVARFGDRAAFEPRWDARMAFTVADASVWDPRDSPGVRVYADEPAGGGYSPSVMPVMSGP